MRLQLCQDHGEGEEDERGDTFCDGESKQGREYGWQGQREILPRYELVDDKTTEAAEKFDKWTVPSETPATQ